MGSILTLPLMQRGGKFLQDNFLLCDVGKGGTHHVRKSVPKSMRKAKSHMLKAALEIPKTPPKGRVNMF